MNRPFAATLTLLLPTLLFAAEPATPPAPAGQAAQLAAPVRVMPVRVMVRVIKGSRKGPAWLDPELALLKQQLSKLAYQRWEQVSGRDFEMTVKKTDFIDLPDGQHVAVTVLDIGPRTATVEVALAQRNTQSRLTIERGRRIIHQVSGEKNGVAYFVTVHVQPAGP